ncbi:MAG: hypothetical protein M3P49_01915 [Actinomycetota bacterium]|nr:hypothetical protein [Actinomycetota bacterium]
MLLPPRLPFLLRQNGSKGSYPPHRRYDCTIPEQLGEVGVARRLFGDLAYRSGALKEQLTEAGVLLAAERANRRPAIRQQV